MSISWLIYWIVLGKSIQHNLHFVMSLFCLCQISLIAKASEEQGGNTAINLKVAEQYIDAFSNLAKTNNTLIVPSNLSDVSGMVGSVMKIVQSTKTAK